MNKVSIKVILFTVILSALIIYLCLDFDNDRSIVNEYYEVYLGGQKIGLITSSDELHNLIDEEQKDIKEKYKVDKVYPPSGLEIQSVLTYKKNLMTVQDIYNEIKDIDPFTIEGYEVSIKKSETEELKVYILNEEDLDIAVNNLIYAFVDEQQYNDYLNGTQKKVTEDGIEITNIYLDNQISIKKSYISTEEKIITDPEELSMYFMFGTTHLTDKYTVKASDTIETIAYNNQLGVSDFLIANPSIPGENALLAEGQQVTVAPIEPLTNIVVELFETEKQTIKHETKIEYDKNLDADTKYTKQKGYDGESIVTYASKKMNGVILTTAQVSETVLSEPIDEIVVVGAKNVVYYGDSTYWAWPTTKPFRISSHYGYRIHPVYKTERLHGGTDISGVKKDDIYAIQSGTVLRSEYNSSSGNFVDIQHANGYVSTYMHLKKRLVNAGDTVEKGQLIGIMGNTGVSTGKYLHLEIRKNGNRMNPMKLYQ